MLTPEYLEKCADEVLALYDALNTSIVEDIARRIVKTGKVTDSASWQIKQVQESGKILDEVVAEVARITKFSDDYIQELFDDAGVTALKYESDICSAAGLTPIELKQSPAMMQTLAAAVEKTQGSINNLTLTTATAAQSLYLQSTNLAYMQVASGAFSYQEAIKQAVRAAAIDGAKVYYSNGHSSKLDVAIRRSVLTGINQTCGTLTEQYAGEMDCDYYETSAHAGARNTGSGYFNHESWQGQVFCISGKDKRYRHFREATGYGEGGGLCGWNCRHSFHMFFPGLSKPAYSKETLSRYSNETHTYKDASGEKHTLTEYECTQRQRAYERQVRESKTLLSGYEAGMKAAPDEKTESALKEEFTAESVRLKQIEAEMRDFCNQTKRPVDSARTQVYAVKDDNGNIVNFNKSVSAKAVWANKKARK